VEIKQIKNMRVLPFLVFAIFFLFSCKSNSSTESGATSETASDLQTLENQVMAVHDEVMPKMKEINELSTQLRAIKSKLKENEVGKIESPAGLDDVVSGLKLAEQSMWDWMKSFSDTKAITQEDQLKAFYEKELEKINKVKQDMLAAIDKAQTWLASQPK
jgi:hypothetical protein